MDTSTSTSMLAVPVLPPVYEEARKSRSSFLARREAKWAAGIIAVSLVAAPSYMVGRAAVASAPMEKGTSIPETTPLFVYFPSQYENAATEVEELPPQF